MNYTLHKDFSQLDAQEWNALLKEAAGDFPFLRYEYQHAWWEHRGGGEWPVAELLLITAREGDKLIGIAPLFMAEYDGRQALLLNGSIEISDYLDVIVRTDDHARFVTGVLDFLASSAVDNWSALDWYNLPDDSPTLAVLQAESTARGWEHHEEVYRPTPRIVLNGSFEDYLASIDKKQRHEIKRKMRRAAESGRVRFSVVGKDADIEPELESFFHLMVQDPNKALFLKDVMRHQMSEVIRGAHKSGYLWLAFLDVDGVKAAAALNFDYNNKLWGYNSGVSRDHMELSPGWVLLGNVIQWCCENGRREFDFMRGDEEYKYRFGAVKRHVMRARVTKK
ncbi:MAG: GNAT family N-acetyltransferase [Anaerolineales bacterium]|nr:MAG: GNAT family N-acetyltransferase [Anaerolineales bacterium]